MSKASRSNQAAAFHTPYTDGTTGASSPTPREPPRGPPPASPLDWPCSPLRPCSTAGLGPCGPRRGQHALVVRLPPGGHLLQLDHALQQRLRCRGAPRDVDVHREELVDPMHHAVAGGATNRAG